MARIFHEIELSVDSVGDDSTRFITTSHSSGEAPLPPPVTAPPTDCQHNEPDSGAVSRVEVETQTTVDDEQVMTLKFRYFALLYSKSTVNRSSGFRA